MYTSRSIQANVLKNVHVIVRGKYNHNKVDWPQRKLDVAFDKLRGP